MTDKHPGDVIDPATGHVRVLARRCSTCIFFPDDRMTLGQDRINEVIQANLDSGTLLTCHSTLPYGENPDFGPAVCNGFWSAHGPDTLAGRLANVVGIERIEPPSSGVNYPEDSYCTTCGTLKVGGQCPNELCFD